jgi:hypothetical protein
MKKEELVNILNETLIPIGFKRKGNYWVINGDELTKMVNLQKSNYSNSFYINYGYILHSIPLIGLMMHDYNRVTSLDVAERKKIESLLNLENNISDEERIRELKIILRSHLAAKLQAINSEQDLLTELKSRSFLGAIPGIVKKYFDL